MMTYIRKRTNELIRTEDTSDIVSKLNQYGVTRSQFLFYFSTDEQIESLARQILETRSSLEFELELSARKLGVSIHRVTVDCVDYTADLDSFFPIDYIEAINETIKYKQFKLAEKYPIKDGDIKKGSPETIVLAKVKKDWLTSSLPQDWARANGLEMTSPYDLLSLPSDLNVQLGIRSLAVLETSGCSLPDHVAGSPGRNRSYFGSITWEINGQATTLQEFAAPKFSKFVLAFKLPQQK